MYKIQMVIEMENLISIFNNVIIFVYWIVDFIITSAMAKVMFSSLSVACLFVCLSVSNITEKRLNGFSWNFQGRWDLIQWTIGNIFRMFHITPWTQDFSLTFSEQSMPLSSIAEKQLNRFAWNFQKRTDMTQGAIWNIFGVFDLSFSWIRVCL